MAVTALSHPHEEHQLSKTDGRGTILLHLSDSFSPRRLIHTSVVPLFLSSLRSAASRIDPSPSVEAPSTSPV